MAPGDRRLAGTPLRAKRTQARQKPRSLPSAFRRPSRHSVPPAGQGRRPRESQSPIAPPVGQGKEPADAASKSSRKAGCVSTDRSIRHRATAVSVVLKVYFLYIQSITRLILSSILSNYCNISYVFLTLSNSFISTVLLRTSLIIRKSFGNFDCTKKAPPLPFAWTEPKCLWSGPASPAAAALAQCPWRRVADVPARSRFNAG